MFLILFQKHPQLLAQRVGKIVRKLAQPFSLPLLSRNLMRRKGLTFRRSRPPTAAAELRALVCENVITESFVLLVQELVSSIAFKIAVRLKVGQHERWKRMALEFFVFALLVIPLFFIFGWLFLQAVSWLL